MVFKVILKDKKGNGKIIAQAVSNLAELVYMPEKGKNMFEQKLALKFHQAYSYSNLLKQHATLNLHVKSVISSGEADNDISFLTEQKTYDHRRYLSTASDKILFDVDQSITTDNDFESLMLEESPRVCQGWMDEISQDG